MIFKTKIINKNKMKNIMKIKLNEITFTKEEIFSEFEKRGIKVPESFEKDFDNTVDRKKRKRNLKYLEDRKSFYK